VKLECISAAIARACIRASGVARPERDLGMPLGHRLGDRQRVPDHAHPLDAQGRHRARRREGREVGQELRMVEPHRHHLTSSPKAAKTSQPRSDQLE
jgi:hypothetical protein